MTCDLVLSLFLPLISTFICLPIFTTRAACTGSSVPLPKGTIQTNPLASPPLHVICTDYDTLLDVLDHRKELCPLAPLQMNVIAMDQPLTTPEVPSRFLEAAFLVGHIPQRVLPSDPRTSYALYVPSKHYNPDPLGAGLGSNYLPRLPLVVFVHGTRRNTSAIFHSWVPFAESTPCAILAPLFPSNMEGANDLSSYKVLRSVTVRSDLALLSMLDEVARCWPGIETGKVYLTGFSGGGQFVHRFLYLYPERLAAASVGAPGKVTILDDQQGWPRGIADVQSIFDRPVQKELIKQVRLQLVVGGADVELHGGKEFLDWVRKLKRQCKHREGLHDGNEEDGKSDSPSMGQGRRDTLERLHTMWKEDGIEAQFDVVPQVGHSAEGVQGYVLAFLQRCIPRPNE